MRIIGQHLSMRLGQPLVIENKAGASSNIGTELVARAPADGYTLLAYGINFTANASLFRSVPYDAQKDFTPVAGLIRTPSVLIVRADSPFKSVADIVQRAREKPGALTYSTGGNGSMAHLCGELFKAGFGIDVLHTPYKGSPEVFNSLLSGQTDYSLPVFNSALSQIKAGAFRGLAVTSAQRMPQLPTAPTMHELMPGGGFDLEAENGIVAPAGTPPEIVARLSAEVASILREPDVANPLVEQGFEIASGTPSELAARIAKDLAKYREVVRKAHAQVD
jgi:tripartite-type tricarboxylate transporter receptor subunit TctC